MTSNHRGPAPAAQTVNPLEDSSWDARLAATPGASFFHGTPWIRVLVDTYGFNPVFFVQGDEAARSIVPLMEVDSWLTGRRGVALPFTDECAPLCGKLPDFSDFFST